LVPGAEDRPGVPPSDVARGPAAQDDNPVERPAEQQRGGLGEFLREHHEDILARWELAVRALPEAQPLPAPALRDHVPLLLEKIAEILHAGDEPRPVTLGDLPDLHALDRLAEGFDLRSAIAELSLLRSVTLELWNEPAAPCAAAAVIHEVSRFNKAIDEIIARSVERYARARARTLVALDRVSSAALGTGDLEQFLPRLLNVLLETTASADSAYIMLRDEGSDVFRVRAAGGTDSELSLGFATRHGIAGLVAKRREPLLVRDASTNPLVQNPALFRANVHAVYFVPLLHGDEVVGIAKLASRSAFDFSDDDKQLLRAMAQRATSIIIQAQLVTREREALAAFRRTAAELQRVMEMSPDMLAILGADGYLKRVNPAFGALLGYSEAELLATPYLEFVHPQDRERVRAEVATVLEGTPARRFMCRVLRKDGSTRWVSFHASAEPGADELVSVGRDVTEERERAELEQQLIGIVSHDLRTPLSTILMSSTSLLRRSHDLDEASLKAVRRIHSASERAAALIRDLLDFTRARRAGKIAIAPQRLDLHAHARRVAEDVRQAAPDRRLEFEQRGDAQGWWDPARVAQVVENLVSNAFKYGASDAPVVVRTVGDDGWVRLEVHNRGNPIDPALLPHIFEPMRQSRAGGVGGAGGVGLGLYIVDHVVRAHGGTVEVRSTADDGTTFVVRIPREPPAQAELPEARPPA
jgi:PAS domain S-box-containing protein